MLQERSQSESSGVNRLDVELVDASKVRAQQDLAVEIRQFRDGLDALKFMLGLSPHAGCSWTVRASLRSRRPRESIENWTKIPKRDPQTLHKLVARWPALGEVVLDRQPLFAQVATNPDQWEEILNHAAELAVKNRKEARQGFGFRQHWRPARATGSASHPQPVRRAASL